MQSRYYDPEMGRFINADSYASTGQGILGNNMFAYCGNNPFNRKDDTGTNFRNTISTTHVDMPGNEKCYCPANNTQPSEFAKKADQAIYDFLTIDYDDFQDIKAVNSVYAGSKRINQGFALIYAPLPSLADEVGGIVLIIWGGISIIVGTGTLAEEEDTL